MHCMELETARRWSSATSCLGSDSGMLLEGRHVYDDVGNLKEIREGKYNKLVEYTYDSQNQLTSCIFYKSGEAYLTYYYT